MSLRAQALFDSCRPCRAELAVCALRRKCAEREQKLGRWSGSAMDAIIELDQHLRIIQ